MAASAQITVADMARIKEMGLKSILCARPDNEGFGQPTAAEIEAAAKASGLEMVYIPVSGRPTVEHASKLAELWPDMSKPCLGYCRSGARVNMLWALLESTE
jgi:sulfide:quinone oxidoreductase